MENQKSEGSPLEPGPDLTEEHENGSRLHFRGPSTLEKDSGLDQEVRNQDRDHRSRQNVPKTQTLSTPPAPSPTHMEPHRAHLPAHPDTLQSPTLAFMEPPRTSLPAHPNPLQTPDPADPDPDHTVLATHLDCDPTPTPAHLDSRRSPPVAQLDSLFSVHLHPHQALLLAHPGPFQVPTPDHLDLRPPADPESHRTSPRVHLDPHLPSCLDLHFITPPAHLDVQPLAHLDLHPAPLPAKVNPLQTPISTYLEPRQTLSSARPDPHQTRTLAQLDFHHTPMPACPEPCETPPPAHCDTCQVAFPTRLNLHGARPTARLDPHLSTDLDPHQASPPAQKQTIPPAHPDSSGSLTLAQPDARSVLSLAYLDFVQTPPLAHISTGQFPPLTRLSHTAHQEPRQVALPAPLDPHRTPAHLDSHQSPAPAHPDPQQTPPTSHPDTHPTPTLALLDFVRSLPRAHPEDARKTCPPAPLDPRQALSCAQLEPPQVPPPAHLDPYPNPAFMDSAQPSSSAHLDPSQAPLTAQLDVSLTTAPAHPDLDQTLPPAHQEHHQNTPPAHLDPHQTPPPAHLDPVQSPASARQDPRQPSLLDPHQASPGAHPDPNPTHPPDALNFAGSSGEPKLCGFLQKQGGPLRVWKRRWFTYEEKQNQLFYYRTPQDVTALGRVNLSSATFTYPLKAEMGVFHIQTPERTYTLKAATQDLMLYWLQQLQLKRWRYRQRRQSHARPEATGIIADDFLPLLKSPTGLVGEEAANEAPQRTTLADVSIKHPFIQLQNTVHSLRKRPSQDWVQSVFYLQAPVQTSGVANNASNPHSASPTVHPAGVAPGEATGALLDTVGGKKSLSDAGSEAVSSETVSRLKRDKEMLMEEVKAQKELVWLLHKTLEAAQCEKRTCADFVAAEDEQERLELLRHRDRQAAHLLVRLEQAQAEAEAARRHLEQRDLQVAELRAEVRKLTEKNHAKREVIIKLSDHMVTCVSEPLSAGASDPDALRGLQQRVEDLKDDIEAYKMQNKFLNSEILQLTKLWRKSSEQERSLMVKCAYLEAWRCRAESRYLGVLRKLQESGSLDQEQRETIEKMMEDAPQGQVKNSQAAAATDRLHDEYGFKIVPDYEVENVKLLAKIQALEIRSHNLLQQEGREHPLSGRWAQYLAGRSDDDLCPSPELKGLLRAGVPPEYRQRVWGCLVRVATRITRERHPQRYQQLCDKSRTCPHPASRQIQLDLHRTLTSNRNFSAPSSPAHQQLQRILLAFSWQNPSVGYCQGLNRLAAIALLVLQNEEEAFWGLVAVVDAIMPQDYYTKNLLAAQADQHVLKDFLVEKLPRLAAHFDFYQIDVSLVTFNWFLVVFVESLPSDILLPLWDAFLYEGTKVMFRYALALFKYKEEDILKIRSSVDIYQYLRFFTKTVTNTRKLMAMAFVDMNPFPGRLLRNRRALHLERLRAELRDLEEQQRAFAQLGAAGEDDEETDGVPHA